MKFRFLMPAAGLILAVSALILTLRDPRAGGPKPEKPEPTPPPASWRNEEPAVEPKFSGDEEESSAPRVEDRRPVSGRVLLPDGRPAVGAVVRAVRRKTQVGGPTKTDEEGRFTISDITSVRFRIEVSGETKEGERLVVTLSKSMQRNGAAPVIKAKRQKRLSGRVYDVGGGVVAGARVFASRVTGPNRQDVFARAVTDEQGEFEMWVAEGFVYAVEAMSKSTEETGLTLGWGALWNLKPGQTDLRLVLSPGEEITGMVVGAGGEPIPNLPLTVHNEQRRWMVINVRTDAGGWFRVRGVSKTWTYGIRAELPGIAEGESGTVQAWNIRGGRRDVKVVCMKFGAFSGKIMRRSGLPLGRWMVYFVHDDLSFECRSATKPDGTFSAKKIPEGSYHLRVMIQKQTRITAYDTHLLGPVRTGDDDVVLYAPF